MHRDSIMLYAWVMNKINTLSTFVAWRVKSADRLSTRGKCAGNGGQEKRLLGKAGISR